MPAIEIDAAFDLLDQWRHLPSYQLERRADIFFAVYLPDYLSHRFSSSFNRLLVPEFPVRKALTNLAYSGLSSFKIDYLALAEDRSRALFVELKTDCGSLRDEQHDYLRAAQKQGLRSLIDDILKIAVRSEAKQKYGRLILLLQQLSLLQSPPTLPANLKDGANRAINVDFRATLATAVDCPVDIIYLQPTMTESDVEQITFVEFADWLNRRREPLATRFADSLRRWSKTLAGCLDNL